MSIFRKAPPQVLEYITMLSAFLISLPSSSCLTCHRKLVKSRTKNRIFSGKCNAIYIESAKPNFVPDKITLKRELLTKNI